MKISQSELKIGDVVLMAKLGNLVVGKIEHITKSGSLRYSFNEKMVISNDYYDFQMDVEKHNKTAYIKKPYRPEYQRYFWLLKREDGKGSH